MISKAVMEALMDMVPKENIHRMKGEIDPQEAAAQYSAEIFAHFGESEPIFDLIMLGMGQDAHTASLFPGLPAIHDKISYIIAHFVPQQNMNRITFAPRIINSAKHVIFVVTDSSKKDAFDMVHNAPYLPVLLPAQIVHPTDGIVIWNVLL